MLTAASIVLAGCGSATHTHATDSKAAEIARERAGASYARPPQAVVEAAGRTAPERNPKARAALLLAASDLQAYRRAHGTFAVGPVASLHRLDRRTALVDFVDARDASFFLAVDPPTTTTIWRYNFDHERAARVCGPGGSGCPPDRRW